MYFCSNLAKITMYNLWINVCVMLRNAEIKRKSIFFLILLINEEELFFRSKLEPASNLLYCRFVVVNHRCHQSKGIMILLVCHDPIMPSHLVGKPTDQRHDRTLESAQNYLESHAQFRGLSNRYKWLYLSTLVKEHRRCWWARELRAFVLQCPKHTDEKRVTTSKFGRPVMCSVSYHQQPAEVYAYAAKR